MEIKLIHKNSRMVIIELKENAIYNTKMCKKIFINNKLYKTTDTVINSIYGLKPDTEYIITVDDTSLKFKTDTEFITLDVKKIGAFGDGKNDDTVFIQAAIMACPENSRVLIPAGKYQISNIFLKSNIKIELDKGAEIIANTKRNTHPIFEGMIQSYDEKSEYNLGTWEGNPLRMFAGILSGINVTNVEIYGEGVINGNASHSNWWENEKVMQGAWRPRLIFLKDCIDIRIIGINLKNSPSWTLHPYFSKGIKIYAIKIENPMMSPNTDGIDIESCQNVEVLGCRFTLGDDCIAIKSGKIYMAKKYKTPSENILIRQCLMENGHGAVTIGSEMAGGVKNLTVSECKFLSTDRGLRIKTRRGRGNLAIVDDVVFKNIYMDGVMTPFVANCFYFCDPDGKSAYVQNKNELPVDERTPYIKRLVFEDIKCYNVHVACGYFYALPEMKIDEIVMKNINVTYADNPKLDVPAMHCDVEIMTKKGIIVRNVKKLVMSNVNIESSDGDDLVIENVNELVR